MIQCQSISIYLIFIGIFNFQIEVEQQVIDPDTGCYNPFIFNGQVFHGCMPFGSDFICSLSPELTGNPNEIIYCDNAEGMVAKIFFLN